MVYRLRATLCDEAYIKYLLIRLHGSTCLSFAKKLEALAIRHIIYSYKMYVVVFFNLISPFAIAAGDIRDSLIASISMNDK